MGEICVKDESSRFGLNAFKGLGGSYCVGRVLAERAEFPAEELPFDRLRQDDVKSAAKDLTLVTATDGKEKTEGIIATGDTLTVSDADGKVFVEHGKRYVFFSPENAPREEAPTVDEYYMTCEKAVETNFLYLIFSPNAFTKASDASAGELLPRMLSFADFQTWLSRCRHHDKEMAVEVRQIVVRKE